MLRKQKQQQQQLRRNMQIQAAQSLARPDIPVEHLMSTFDDFYGEVVSRQMVKDRASMKKKYENATELGEGEQKHLRNSVIVGGASTAKAAMAGNAPLLPIHHTAFDEVQFAHSNISDALSSGYHSGPITSLARPAGMAQNQWITPAGSQEHVGQQLHAATTANLEINNSAQYYRGIHCLDEMNHDTDGNLQSLTQDNIKVSGPAQNLSATSFQQKFLTRPASQGGIHLSGTQSSKFRHSLQAGKPGSGIAQYTLSQKQALLSSLGQPNSRARSSRIGGGHKVQQRMGLPQTSGGGNASFVQQRENAEQKNFMTERGGGQSFGRSLTGNDKNSHSHYIRANNEHLLQKMLTDDEQYRERLLHGFLQAQTNQVSPVSIAVASKNCSSRRGRNAFNQLHHLSTGRLAGGSQELRPGTASTNCMTNKNKKSTRTTAPHNLTGLEKVQKIYSGAGGISETNDSQTMHTSEANLASMRLINHNQILAQAQRHQMMQDYEQINFQMPNQNQLANGHEIAVGNNTQDQVFKSLEIDNFHSSGYGANLEGGRDGDMVQHNKLKQRPMTGAALGGSRRAFSKNRRFGPYGGIPSGLNLNSQQTNRISLKNYTQTLQTFEQIEPSRFYQGEHNSNVDQRNRSTAFFSSAQQKQSQQALMIGQSLQHLNNLQTKSTTRARSSTYNNNNNARLLNSRVKPGSSQRDEQLSFNAQSRPHMNLMSATALSQIPPKTNVQVLDDYYSNYDTQGQIGSIKFSAEYERQVDKIEKFWKLKGTSDVEREKVRKVLSQMQSFGEAHECSELSQRNMLTAMTEYLKMMKDYYQTEAEIRNIYQERLNIKRELIVVSNSFDQQLFATKGMSLVLKLRMLTVKLVYAVKKWKDMVKRATATFTIGNALQGQDIGKNRTIRERNESNLKIHSLKASSDLAQSSVSTAASSGFKSSGDKFRHQFKQEQLSKLNDQKVKQMCILCQLSKDVSVQKEGGLLIRKLANFTQDSIVFQMRNFEEARVDIKRLSLAFTKEPAFKFNENELTYFGRLFKILEPKKQANQHMKSAFEYLSQHICESSSTLKPKPKDFEFNFVWHCDDDLITGQNLAQPNNCLAEVRWNFSNLDRSDRIHMVYNTLQDGMAQQSQTQKTGSKLSIAAQKNKDLATHAKLSKHQGRIKSGGVISNEHIILEDEETSHMHIQHEKSPSLKLSNQSLPQSEACQQMTNQLKYNLDLGDELLEGDAASSSENNLKQQINGQNHNLAEVASANDPHVNGLSGLNNYGSDGPHMGEQSVIESNSTAIKGRASGARAASSQDTAGIVEDTKKSLTDGTCVKNSCTKNEESMRIRDELGSKGRDSQSRTESALGPVSSKKFDGIDSNTTNVRFNHQETAQISENIDLFNQHMSQESSPVKPIASQNIKSDGRETPAVGIEQETEANNAVLQSLGQLPNSELNIQVSAENMTMIKKDRYTSANNLEADKAIVMGSLGGHNELKYGSQEAIYPPGHIEFVKQSQKSMQIQHAEFILQRQIESSNSQVHIIDDRSSSQTCEVTAQQAAQKRGGEEEEKNSKTEGEAATTSQFGHQTLLKHKLLQSQITDVTPVLLEENATESEQGYIGDTAGQKRQMTNSTQSLVAQQRLYHASQPNESIQQEDDYESCPNTVQSVTTGGKQLRMKVKHQLTTSQVASQGNKASSTVVTDKSPNDYVNQVTIDAHEGRDASKDSSYGSQAYHGHSLTEKSVTMTGAIHHHSQEQPITVPNMLQKNSSGETMMEPKQ